MADIVNVPHGEVFLIAESLVGVPKVTFQSPVLNFNVRHVLYGWQNFLLEQLTAFNGIAVRPHVTIRGLATVNIPAAFGVTLAGNLGH